MSTAEVSSDNWIEVGRLDSIERRSARVVKTRDGDIAIFRTSSDEVYALKDSCPHQGGPLSQGIISGTGVTCPLHSWCIELKTGEARDPDEGETPTYPVRVEDGVIHLSLEAEA